jgi:hypothetical protein
MGINKHLERLEEKLEENIYVHGVATYKVTEYSKSLGKIEYETGMLRIEACSDIVITLEDVVLLNKGHILKNFFVHEIEKITIYSKRISIDFKDGSYIILNPVM